MRRSGSSSCMLRPKNSLSEEDLQLLSDPNYDPPSATVLTLHHLPSYSMDRDYLLSEIGLYAHSVQFLCDWRMEAARTRNEISTDPTDVTDDDEDGRNHEHGEHGENHKDLPPSIILYLIWKPDTYPTATHFVDHICDSVVECLERSGENYEDLRAELEHDRSNPCSPPYSPRRQSQQMQSTNDLNASILDEFEASLVNEEQRKHSNVSNVNTGDITAAQSFENDESSNDSPTKQQTSSPRKRLSEQNRRQNGHNEYTRIYVVVDRISSSYEMNTSTNSACSSMGGGFQRMSSLPRIPDLGGDFNSETVGSNSNISNGNNSSHKHHPQHHGLDSISVLPVNKNTQHPQNHPHDEYDNLNPPNKETQTRNIHHSDELTVDTEPQPIDRYNIEKKNAEALVRAVTSSRFLKHRIDGIAVGHSSDVHASPGLELCLVSIERGSKERRQVTKSKSLKKMSKEQEEICDNHRRLHREQPLAPHEICRKTLRTKSPIRSPIAIVASQPDDLEGDQLHHHHHHHHSPSLHENSMEQKLFQSCFVAEWNGNGDFKTFGDRSMRFWRTAWCESSGENGYSTGGSLFEREGSKGRANSGFGISTFLTEYSSEFEAKDLNNEPVSTLMVFVFLIGVAAYVWQNYGNVILAVLVHRD